MPSVITKPMVATREYLEKELEIIKSPGLVFRRVSIFDFVSALSAKDYSLVLSNIDDIRKPYQKASYSLFSSQLKSIAVADNTPPKAFDSHFRVKRRLVYCLHNSAPFSSGGYATRAHGIAQELLRRYPNLMCLPRPGFPWDTSPSPEKLSGNMATVDSVKYLFSSEPNRKTSKNYALSCYSYYSQMFSIFKPEVVLTASAYTHSLPVLLAACHRHAQGVYEVRGFWEITRVSRDPSFLGSVNHITSVLLESLCAGLASSVATLTTPMKNLLEMRGIPSHKIYLAPNSVPREFLTKKTSYDYDLAKSLGIKEDDIVIGYIGSFVQYEGIELLCASVCELAGSGHKFKLLLVGSENASAHGEQEDGPITKEIKRIKEAYQSAGQSIILTGRVPHDAIHSYYSLVAISAFPRYSQPVTDIVSPIKPLEAASLGKAVLMSDVGGMTEILDETSCIRFQAGNQEDLKHKLEQLACNMERISWLGKNAKRWVKDNRTWDKSVKNLQF